MHPQALARLAQVADVRPLPHQRDLAAAAVAGCEGVIAYVPPFDAAALVGASALKVISCHSCPPDLLAAAQARAVVVTEVPSLWDTVAEMTLGLLFACARFIPQADAAVRAGRWVSTDLKVELSGFGIFGKTLGIVGLGRIGAAVARRVGSFDMPLLYTDPCSRPDLEAELGLRRVPLAELLATSDIVSVHAPLDDGTHGLIGERELLSMKRNALLLNTARGALLDQEALYRALAEGWIAGAALDVLIEEPIGSDNPLLTLGNVVVAPHLGGSTLDCDLVLVEDVIRVLSGHPPIHAIGRAPA